MIDLAGRSVVGSPVGEAQVQCARELDALAGPGRSSVVHDIVLANGHHIDHVVVSGSKVTAIYSSRSTPNWRSRREIRAQLIEMCSASKVSYAAPEVHQYAATAHRVMREASNDEIVERLAAHAAVPIRPTGYIAAGVPA